MQIGDNLRQQIRANGGDQTNMQRPGHRFPLLAGHLFQHLDFTQYGARLIHQQQTRLSK